MIYVVIGVAVAIGLVCVVAVVAAAILGGWADERIIEGDS